MADSSADRDPLDRLAEEFVARFRAGERPSLTEYADRMPERADEVRELFPALVEMEQLKPITADFDEASTLSAEPTDPVRLGDFRILRRVGQGGMGVVYEAIQESLGRHVALKLLPSEAFLDPRKLERFRREAKSAARLHHTNIVPVFGTGEADGRYYYAMQFIGGQPLDAVVNEVKRLKERSGLAPLPSSAPAVSQVAAALATGSFISSSESDAPSSTAEASASPSPSSDVGLSLGTSPSLSAGGQSFWSTVARVGIQVADALAYAHGQGIQHRDIKPANLLLDLHGVVWVTDFGLAKSSDADDLTHTGDILGTLRYMAPERFEGAGDERADIYALGLTLYELLTLTPAFAADRRAKLIEQVLAANPPRPRSVNPKIPRDLETIVLKAIARDPAGRYQTAAELRDDLQRYLEGRTITARRVSTAERVWRAAKRNPALSALSVAAVFLLIAGTTVSLAFAFQAEHQRRTAQDREKDALDAQAKAEIAQQQANERAEEIARQQAETSVMLYTSRMNLASAAAAEFRIPRLRELLDDAALKAGETDRRGWEWYYLNRLANLPYRRTLIDMASLKEFKNEIETPDADGDFSLGLLGGQFSVDGQHFYVAPSARGFGRAQGQRGAIFDLTTGKGVRDIPVAKAPLQYVGSTNGLYTFATEPHATGEGFRLRVMHLATGKEVLPPIDFPPPLRTTDGGYFKLNVALSADATQLVALSPVPPVAYIWRKATGQVETRRLAPFDEEQPAKRKASEGVPWHLWFPTRDGKSVVGFTSSSKTDPKNRSQVGLFRVEIHDLTGPPTPPTILEDVALNQTSLFAFHHHGSISPVLPVLDGEAGRVVRLLDTRTKQWSGRWVIPANIPLAWDTQMNSMMKLHASDDGRRVILGAGNGLFLLGERVDPASLTRRTENSPDEIWRTVVFHPSKDANVGFEPMWFAPDGKRFASLHHRTSERKLGWEVREWALDPLPGYSETWPESMTVDGLNCARAANLRTARWDVYSGQTPTERVNGLIVVRDRSSGQTLRSLKFPAPNEIPNVGPLTVASLSSDGRRAMTYFTNSLAVSGGSPLEVGPVKRYGQLVALDRPERPVLRSFAAVKHDAPSLQMSHTGRWVLEEIPAEGAPKTDLRTRTGLRSPKSLGYRVYSSETGDAVGTIPAEPALWQEQSVSLVGWARDDRLLLVACSPHVSEHQKANDATLTIRAYDVQTGQERWRWQAPKPGMLNGLIFGASSRPLSSDGKTVALQWRGEEGEMVVWIVDVETGQLQRELLSERDRKSSHNFGQEGATLPNAAFGPHGEIAIAGYAEVPCWNRHGKPFRLKGHEPTVLGSIFSPDGERLFTVDVNSNGHRTVRVWDTNTGRELITIREPTMAAKIHCRCEDVPNNLRFDGQRLLMDSPGVSMMFDGTPTKK